MTKVISYILGKTDSSTTLEGKELKIEFCWSSLTNDIKIVEMWLPDIKDSFDDSKDFMTLREANFSIQGRAKIKRACRDYYETEGAI